MTFRQMSDSKKIKEFLDMVENVKIEIRRYRYPILVWAVKDGTAYYAIWEKEILDKFGLDNVDGWDYEEDVLFCPDWIDDRDDDWDDDDLDDDDDDFDLSGFDDFKDSEKD